MNYQSLLKEENSSRAIETPWKLCSSGILPQSLGNKTEKKFIVISNASSAMKHPWLFCHKHVRPRQQALLCDGCSRWQNRVCNTGITQDEYREAVRNDEWDTKYVPETVNNFIKTKAVLVEETLGPGAVLTNPGPLWSRAVLTGKPPDRSWWGSLLMVILAPYFSSLKKCYSTTFSICCRSLLMMPKS